MPGHLSMKSYACRDVRSNTYGPPCIPPYQPQLIQQRGMWMGPIVTHQCSFLTVHSHTYIHMYIWTHSWNYIPAGHPWCSHLTSGVTLKGQSARTSSPEALPAPNAPSGLGWGFPTYVCENLMEEQENQQCHPQTHCCTQEWLQSEFLTSNPA